MKAFAITYQNEQRVAETVNIFAKSLFQAKKEAEKRGKFYRCEPLNRKN